MTPSMGNNGVNVVTFGPFFVDRSPATNRLEVILSWDEELKELVPTGR